MNPAHLDTLVRIIDEGSFEDAAYALGITPSAVSQRMKALERATGRVLLRRTSPVTATPAGEVMVQAARRLALLQAETQQALEDSLGRIPLSIAVNADTLATWFRPVLAEVAAWDNSTLQLTVEDESQSLHLLRRGDVMGAITRDPNPVAGCVASYVGAMQYIPVANPTLVDAYTKEDGGLDWEKMPTIRFNSKDLIMETEVMQRTADMRKLRIHEIPDAHAFLEATRVGLGWSLLPIQMARTFLDSGDMVRLDSRVRRVDLYWHRWLLESPTLDRLTDAVSRAASVLSKI